MPRWPLLVLVPLLLLASCASRRAPTTGLHGTLLAIGGGLSDDNRLVYERFAQLAAQRGPARLVIATAASADQDAAAKSKTESLAKWCPGATIDVITRETSAEQTVAIVDLATVMFFTGGDQKRITDRYRPGDAETPESAAMRRLLDRGGVIAGTSAGDAMMSRTMFLTGRSAEALGIRPTRAAPAEEDAPATRTESPLGPQIGPGMGFISWVITDSHFFERNRVGRLVAALEVSGQGLGLGVGEDACVEFDLATGSVTGVSTAESLLVDAAHLQRDGLARHTVLARLIRRGESLSLTDRLRTPPPPPPGPPSSLVQDIPTVDGSKTDRLASRTLFSRASTPGSGRWRLSLDGWNMTAWPDGRGGAVFDIDPSIQP